VSLQQATQRAKDETDSFATNKKIIKLEESINENCEKISKLKDQYEKDLMNLKNVFTKNLDDLEDSNSKFKEMLSRLKEMKESLNSTSLLSLLDLQIKYAISPEEKKKIEMVRDRFI
jgi:uncharacterized phage infection (PIP) family protein YhgE